MTDEFRKIKSGLGRKAGAEALALIALFVVLALLAALVRSWR